MGREVIDGKRIIPCSLKEIEEYVFQYRKVFTIPH